MNYLIGKQKIYESAFYPYGDGIITLPHRIRAYIDSSSDEFSHLTIENKLCDLGFAVTRGINLYTEIKKDISEHAKDVQYRSYEDNIKSSLFSYIDYLRETETLLTETLLEQKDIDLMQLVDLLVEEILLRYNEYPDVNSNEYTIIFRSIPLDYTAIINRFNIKSSEEKQSCHNYLLTAQESISKAVMNKDYVLYLNRWKELLPKLSGYDLYFADDLVFPGDEEYVYAYNEKQKDNPTRQLVLCVPPEPWSGNILNSKLVILSLNPGYVEHLNKNLANMFKPQMAEEIMEDKRKVLSMEGTKFDYYEPTRILGDYYWRKKILPLGTAVYGEQEKENIFNHIYVTGNTIIDSFRTTVRGNYVFENEELQRIDFINKKVIVLTAHRRENIGQPLNDICKAIRQVVEENEEIEVVYPVHPNPAVREIVNTVLNDCFRVHLLSPIDVLDMHNLIARSYFVVTDSGGLQEEAPALGKPVLVVRTETERPEAVEAGTVKVVGVERNDIYQAATELLSNYSEYQRMSLAVSPYGDGHASERIVKILLEHNK